MNNRVFGELGGETIRAYTIGVPGGLTVEILDWGASINSVRLDGKPESEVAVGFADVSSRQDEYFGAIIGRVSNRIKSAQIDIDGQQFLLAPNEAANTLHGGPQGFSARRWTVNPGDVAERAADTELENPGGTKVADTLHLSLFSPDGDQGFPGNVSVNATYRVAGCTLGLEMEATTDAPTALSLTNHAYWNLAGAGTIDGHLVAVDADYYLPIDGQSIPTGELSEVTGTPFDLRTLSPIGRALRHAHPQIGAGRGIDHTFCVRGRGMRRHARVEHPDSGRAMEVWSDQPGIQVYTGNFLDGSLVARGGAWLRHGRRSHALDGKDPKKRQNSILAKAPRDTSAGTTLRRLRAGDALALEPGCYPDTVHHPEWGNIILRPGEKWCSRIEWRLAAT